VSTPQARPSRYAERLATRRLVTRHGDRLELLSTVLGRTPEEARGLARQAVSLARREGRGTEDALTRAFSRLTVTLPDPPEARGRLALLLVDVERRPPDEAARLLDMEADALVEVLASARRTHPERACRGWGLASGRPGLTDAERTAGAAHVQLCRRCRERLTAVERVRAQVLGGSAGVVGAVAGAQLIPWGGAAGTLVTGKAAAGVIGAVGAAVLATGGAVAVSHAQPPRPAPAPAVTRDAVPGPTTAPAPRARSVPTRPAPTPAPGPTHVPLPLPSSLPTAVPAAPVPTLPVPHLPVPQLPVVPLPSVPALPELPGPLVTPVQRLLDLG
jgi:hypothetical protein